MFLKFRFLLGVIGIYYAFINIGILQEKIFKHNYGTSDKPSPKFEYPFSTTIGQMFLSTLFGLGALIYQRQKLLCTFKETVKMGILNYSAIASASVALQFVSFPLQALTKSCKILSVLIVGLILGGVQFTRQQIFCGVFVTFGILLFNISESKGAGGETSIIGVLLLLVSLFSDGMLATTQQQIKEHKKITNWEFQFSLSVCSLIASIIQVFFYDYWGFLDLLQKYPNLSLDLLFYSFYGLLGQISIFYTLSHSTPLHLAIVTTSRKFLTVLTSILLHGHKMIILQWLALILVAFGLYIELRSSYEKDAEKTKLKMMKVKMPESFDDPNHKQVDEKSSFISEKQKKKT
ncbi:hypothetical protein pb186bvf_005603 [Paramecium bursaria]